MPMDRFLVGFWDESAGLQTNFRPWLIADNAFSLLKNAYVFRGRVRKRFGSTLMGDSQLNSRLRVKLGTTSGAGALAGNVAGVVFAVGQMFSIGAEIFTVNTLGAPAALLSTGAGTGTYNTTTGAYSFTGADATTDVFFYPATPVMGITQYEDGTGINNEPTVAFDTQFAYEFDTTVNAWDRLSTGTDTWVGSDSQFFWSTNYQGATPDVNLLWVTNFNTTDGIRYWNGTTWTTPTLQYAANAPGPNNIVTARIIVVFKNRLLFLNTVESVDGVNTSYVQRCRYSAVGSPLAADAWRQDVPGNGSAIDAPTQEAIITAQFLRDRLIVYFERSTWELVYTGNQVLPFAWQQINTELGAESTFSQVPFDKAVLGIGNVGIHACNGVNVDRIDAKIPQLVYSFHNANSGVERVAGIRDYFSELVYWTYPAETRDANFPFPNRTLVYNYQNNSWGINDDSYTAFGYFLVGPETPGGTWEDTPSSWEENGEIWNAAQNVVRFRAVVAGNQQGWINILRRDINRNAPSVAISDVTTATNTITAINHNLILDDYVLLEGINGITLTDDNGNVVTSIIVRVSSDTVGAGTPNTFTVQGVTMTGTYTGGGTAARVSKIDIKTKEYSFYAPQDRNMALSKVDFLVDKTDSGSIEVDFFASTSTANLVDDGANNGSLQGTSTLETSPYDPTLVPLESSQVRVWHPVYMWGQGECVQLRIYLNDTQLRNADIALEGFQLHAMNFYVQPTSSRMQ